MIPKKKYNTSVPPTNTGMPRTNSYDMTQMGGAGGGGGMTTSFSGGGTDFSNLGGVGTASGGTGVQTGKYDLDMGSYANIGGVDGNHGTTDGSQTTYANANKVTDNYKDLEYAANSNVPSVPPPVTNIVSGLNDNTYQSSSFIMPKAEVKPMDSSFDPGSQWAGTDNIVTNTMGFDNEIRPDDTPPVVKEETYADNKATTTSSIFAANTDIDNTLPEVKPNETLAPPLAPPVDQLTEQMRLRTEQDNLRNMQASRRNAHDRAVREGYPPGSAQYEQMMRNAETDASRQNMEQTNKFREFSTQRQDENKDRDMREFKDIIGYVESANGQSMLAALKAEGGDWQTSMNNMYTTDATGKRTLKPEYQDKNQAELIRETFKITAESMGKTTSETEAWVNDKMEKWGNQMSQGLDITGDQNTAKSERDVRIASAIDGGDASLMYSDDWKHISTTDLGKLNLTTVTKASTYLRPGDFAEANLRADVVETQTDDKPASQESSSAGEGKGSIVMYNNKPYRISYYRSKKDTTGTNERIGEYTLVPVSGEGSEVTISTGWKDI